MPEQTMSEEELAGYEFGEIAAPEGFNPDARGFANPPPGQYVMRMTTCELKTNHTWTTKDSGEWLGNQHRPHLEVMEGKHAGKTIIDFLPIPTPESQIPRVLANRWANHITAFGFRPPPNAVVPPGFKYPEDLVGKTALVTIEEDTYDGERQEKERAAGRIPVRVLYFGYSPVDAAASPPASKPTPVKTSKSTTGTPGFDAPPTSDLNLDDL